MSTLYIHVGTAKTATTLVQNQFSKGGILECVGISYPFVGRGPGGHAHHQLSAAVLEGSDSVARDLDGLTADQTRPTLLSSEGFANVIGDVQYPNFRDFVAGAEDRGWQPRLIVFIREATSFIESWYLQRVKSGRTVDPFETFAQSGQTFFTRLFDHLAEMRDAAIPQRVYPFDPTRLQEDWCDALEVPVRLNVTRRDNPRFPLKAMAFLLNLDDIAREHGVKLDRRASKVRFKLGGSPFADDTSDYALWSADAARKLHARMRTLALEHGYPAYADAFPTAPEPRQPVRLEDVLLSEDDKRAGVAFLTRAVV